MKLYFIFSIIIILIYLWIKSKKSIHMLQQNWYDDDHRYLKWIVKNKNKVFVDIDSFFVFFIFFLFINSKIQIILVSIFYIVNIYFTKRVYKKEQTKLSLVYTKRVNRLIVTLFILYLIPILSMVYFFSETIMPYYYLFIGALLYLNYFMVMLANIVNIPIEKQVFYHYRRKAIKKLKEMKQLKVIGITGSYGKTSSKNILNDILDVKLNAFATPKNFNTPYGLIRSINNYLDKFSDVFIAEMGAFKKGEIKENCDLVHPKYGILTKIGTAHLESFGSRENIQTGKFELIESLPEEGVGVLNGDDEYQVSYSIKNNCKIIWIGIENENVDIKASNIKMNKDGMQFDVSFKKEKKKYHFETRLLGKANIYNILASLALAEEFGITKEQMQLGVTKVKPVEHRLEIKPYGNVTLIDDAYNSNPVGSSMALEVLEIMPGKKIIITPGMIELGERQYELNMKFGKQIAQVCDEVILVGEKQTKPIYDGLENEKFKKENIHIVNDVKLAFQLLNKFQNENTYVLIENDLPDLFNEK